MSDSPKEPPGTRSVAGQLLGKAGRVVIASDAGGVRILADREDREVAREQAPDQRIRVRDKGTRRAEVVRFVESHWVDDRDRDRKGSDRDVDLFVRVMVKPPEGADIDRHKVGVVFRLMADEQHHTQEGLFRRIDDDGWQHWEVRLCLGGAHPGVLKVIAWYDDGHGLVSYDDNQGQWHPIVWRSPFEVVRHEHEGTDARVTPVGIVGRLSVLVADIEYHKEIALVYSTDGWKTQGEFGMGSGKNAWRWLQDVWGGFQRWVIDLDIPGDFQQMEYAIVYRHGGVPGAKAYEFWADNGQRNFMIRAEDNRRQW